MRKTRYDYIREYAEQKERKEARLDYERTIYGKIVKEAIGFIETPLIEQDLPELEKCFNFVHVWLKRRIEEHDWEVLTPTDMMCIWEHEVKAFCKKLKRQV